MPRSFSRARAPRALRPQGGNGVAGLCCFGLGQAAAVFQCALRALQFSELFRHIGLRSFQLPAFLLLGRKLRALLSGKSGQGLGLFSGLRQGNAQLLQRFSFGLQRTGGLFGLLLSCLLLQNGRLQRGAALVQPFTKLRKFPFAAQQTSCAVLRAAARHGPAGVHNVAL